MKPLHYEFAAIGRIRSCFKEKFGIPRQPGLVRDARGIIELNDDPDLRTALRTLETFSHLWIVFVFHEHGSQGWKPSIRPPRLGGARKVGVLASRSPHRPNPIGLSAVEIERVEIDAAGGPRIHVKGVDLLDGTPVLDVKPYIPYADSIPNARAGWAEEPIQRTPVEFSTAADRAVAARENTPGFQNLRELIVQLLELDPRPAFQKRRMPPESPEAQGARFGFNLLEFDVRWEIRDGKFIVLELAPISN